MLRGDFKCFILSFSFHIGGFFFLMFPLVGILKSNGLKQIDMIIFSFEELFDLFKFKNRFSNLFDIHIRE